MLEDKLLIRKLKHGSSDALRRLYEKYKDNLRTIAAAMLHDTNTAEDVLHDVFIAFAENVRRLEINTSLKNYLTMCVINRVRDEFRRKAGQAVALDGADAPDCRSQLLRDDMLTGIDFGGRQSRQFAYENRNGETPKRPWGYAGLDEPLVKVL